MRADKLPIGKFASHRFCSCIIWSTESQNTSVPKKVYRIGFCIFCIIKMVRKKAAKRRLRELTPIRSLHFNDSTSTPQGRMIKR